MFQTFLLTKTVFRTPKGAQPLFQARFGVKILSGTLFAPPLMNAGYGARLEDLYHFLLLFLLIYLAFTLLAVVQFGGSRPEFSSTVQAIETQFDMMLGGLPEDFTDDVTRRWTYPLVPDTNWMENTASWFTMYSPEKKSRN